MISIKTGIITYLLITHIDEIINISGLLYSLIGYILYREEDKS